MKKIFRVLVKVVRVMILALVEYMMILVMGDGESVVHLGELFVPQGENCCFFVDRSYVKTPLKGLGI